MLKYVLISPARNEEKFIRKTLDSMVVQTHLPEKWVIVDDGSTDSTADIVREYLDDHSWIELVQRPEHMERSFSGKVHAFNEGREALGNLEYEVIGNLDADLSFDPDYLCFLLDKFETDPELGVAGTPFLEEGYDSAQDSFEGENHVAGGCQLFRRSCFDEIGGYVPNRAGGIDWVAVTTARMKGWKTRSFREKRFNHFRPLGTAERGVHASSFSYGEKDYYLGNAPVWEVFRFTYRMTKQPLVTGGCAMAAGYLWAVIRRIPRAVSPELMKFHRREQMAKLKGIIASMMARRKVDAFRPTSPVNGNAEDSGQSGLQRLPNEPNSKGDLQSNGQFSEQVEETLEEFIDWLEKHGESSWDHQSFFAGAFGRRAKSLFYQNKVLGLPAVLPMILCEAVLPAGRRLFHHPIRFPIADAHYAMGFACLYRRTGDRNHFERMTQFLDSLEKSRSPGYEEYCWGYPFDWVTQHGTIKENTPFITTTPYAFEAFHAAYQLEPREEWMEIMASIARHCAYDIPEFASSPTASSCGYAPDATDGGVVNAAAYRAWILASASRVFSKDEYWNSAQRNLNFVLQTQNPDGSWYYSEDGTRDFVDHFHSCFVMKALAKIHGLTGHEGILHALEKGIDYYLKNLFAEDGLPCPFSKAPRLTVYERELYDCAECINLCLLLRDRFPGLNVTLRDTIQGILDEWIKPDGSFRGRRLKLGWDNTPMHRWGQSQMFRSLAMYSLEPSPENIVDKEVGKELENVRYSRSV